MHGIGRPAVGTDIRVETETFALLLLGAVTGVAQALQIRAIKQQLHVTTMRLDVIDAGRCRGPTLAQAFGTQRIAPAMPPAELVPLRGCGTFERGDHAAAYPASLIWSPAHSRRAGASSAGNALGTAAFFGSFRRAGVGPALEARALW